MHAHLTGNYHQLLVDQEISMQTRVFDKVQFTEQLAQLNRTRSVRHGNDFVTPSALNGFKFISADMEIVMPGLLLVYLNVMAIVVLLVVIVVVVIMLVMMWWW